MKTLEISATTAGPNHGSAVGAHATACFAGATVTSARATPTAPGSTFAESATATPSVLILLRRAPQRCPPHTIPEAPMFIITLGDILAVIAIVLFLAVWGILTLAQHWRGR